MPPLALTVADPLPLLKQFRFVEEAMAAVNVFGSVTVIVVVAVHEFASVTM